MKNKFKRIPFPPRLKAVMNKVPYKHLGRQDYTVTFNSQIELDTWVKENQEVFESMTGEADSIVIIPILSKKAVGAYR
jgi:hypothetical protein